ncbi:MAG: AAA family ATPase [Sphaerospermopsis sp. SIO1G2]|nr:AAA family ATPase [Sphaerospermopsis sp. SIO1G2]
MKHFNTAGPCHPQRHYMLPATQRLKEENIARLIETDSYFVVHAPRQTGKTTAMVELAKELTASGQYTSALVSMEVGAGFPDDIGAAEDAILSNWRKGLSYDLPKELQPPPWPEDKKGERISSALQAWAEASSRPLVLFLDEIDALQDHVLISVLRQLRSGFRWRPKGFPAALALIGLRDVRDYKIKSGGSPRLGSPSPFNIAVRAITLRNFSAEETKQLLQQHTAETGQVFTAEALNRVGDLTQGQPWLVNALASVATEELVQNDDQPITADVINQAKEILILRRQTHLDQLLDKLRQERVKHVIEPLLAGGVMDNVSTDDRDYVVDLGLVRRLQGGHLVVANPIYQEIIPRELASGTQDSLPMIQPSWLTADNKLDPDELLASFISFWKQHGQPLLKSAPYHEIAPHLVMMAYLHRVVNGEGTIEREYAIGSRRIDLLVRYGDVQVAMELKVWRDGHKNPTQDGLSQLDRYLDGLGLETGWLVIFDQRSGQPDISERARTETAVSPKERQVTLIYA